jgi:hypothetical protein
MVVEILTILGKDPYEIAGSLVFHCSSSSLPEILFFFLVID